MKTCSYYHKTCLDLGHSCIGFLKLERNEFFFKLQQVHANRVQLLVIFYNFVPEAYHKSLTAIPQL